MHSARMSAKNSTENTTADTPGRFGAMAISNVLADVRGMATIGPTHRMIAHMRISAGTRPTRWSTASLLPTRSSANMAASARPMSAMKYALESGQPRRSGFHAQIRREDHVPGAEEHGKQGKANNDDIAAGPVFRFFHDFLSFDFPKRDSRFLFRI